MQDPNLHALTLLVVNKVLGISEPLPGVFMRPSSLNLAHQPESRGRVHLAMPPGPYKTSLEKIPHSRGHWCFWEAVRSAGPDRSKGLKGWTKADARGP